MLTMSDTEVQRHLHDGEERHDRSQSPAQRSERSKDEHHLTALSPPQSENPRYRVSYANPADLRRPPEDYDDRQKPPVQISLSSTYVRPPSAVCHMHTEPQPVYSHQYSNNFTAHTGATEPSYPLHQDRGAGWDVPDGVSLKSHQYEWDSGMRTVGARKPIIKSPAAHTFNVTGGNPHKGVSLGELCERKQEILHQLKGFTTEESKNPWDRNHCLTKTVTSLWTIPTESISKKAPSPHQDDVVCYNPWTSQAPFCPLVRPVKETNTNYTMTYIKAHVRHMSVDEHHGSPQDKPLGTHELSEFKKMSLQDLEHTLQKVKQEDEHAGSCHHERGHKIQLEMDRRVQQQNSNWEVSTGASANTAAKQAKHPYTSDSNQSHMMRYYQALSSGAPRELLASRHGSFPMSKSSRTAFKSTGPIQVHAGPLLETNPVALTQDCHVASSFQSSPSEGYQYLGQPKQDPCYPLSRSLNTKPSKGSEGERSQQV